MLIVKIKRRLALIAMRAIQRVRVLWYSLLSTNRFQGKPTLYQPLQVAGRGAIVFAPNVSIGVFPSPNFLDSYAYLEARTEDAAITVGKGTWINNGFRCIAEHAEVGLGRNCLIQWNVQIMDCDFHRLKVQERRMPKLVRAASGNIGNGVLIGPNSRMLKAARIGIGFVTSNSFVVIRAVPKNLIAAGAPARVVRELAA